MTVMNVYKKALLKNRILNKPTKPLYRKYPSIGFGATGCANTPDFSTNAIMSSISTEYGVLLRKRLSTQRICG